jgi:HPt (histidine-containing phosphotransfer) domain-containing protein
MTNPVDLHRIEELSDGTSTGLREIVELLVEDSRETLIAMSDTLDRSDRAGLKLLAHRFGGTCSIVGAAPLGRRLWELEHSAPLVPMSELAEHMRGIERECNTTITFLMAYLEGQPRP